jgi:GNAT superfamily N-acetyltransferase
MSAATVSCRLATPADAAALAELFWLCDRHYWGDKATPLESILEHVRARVLAAEADARILLAEIDGKAVGFACFALLFPAPDAGGQIYMKELFVREDARGNGIGPALLRAVAKAGVERGAMRLDWTAEDNNPRAVEFYDRIGARRLTEKIYFRFDGEKLKAFAEGE